MLILIGGKSGHVYGFAFRGDPASLQLWRGEGFTVHEVEAAIPVWVVRCRLVRPWAAMQAAWQWLRVW